MQMQWTQYSILIRLQQNEVHFKGVSDDIMLISMNGDTTAHTRVDGKLYQNQVKSSK